MPHSYSSLLVHAVFSTKDRARCIDPPIRPDLFAYMGGIVQELGGKPVMINGIDDHAHMLFKLPADRALADCLRIIKTNSSRWVHEKYADRGKFAWQTGYGAFAVSASNERRVIRYIQEQEKHHRRMSFQEEFVALLRKHGIEFDQRYLWQ